MREVFDLISQLLIACYESVLLDGRRAVWRTALTMSSLARLKRLTETQHYLNLLDEAILNLELQEVYVSLTTLLGRQLENLLVDPL